MQMPESHFKNEHDREKKKEIEAHFTRCKAARFAGPGHSLTHKGRGPRTDLLFPYESIPIGRSNEFPIGIEEIWPIILIQFHIVMNRVPQNMMSEKKKFKPYSENGEINALCDLKIKTS